MTLQCVSALIIFAGLQCRAVHGIQNIVELKLHGAHRVVSDEGGRPGVHFVPEKGWMNDPCGLVYYQGEYHLFFQSQPNNKRPGPFWWGHAVSDNLFDWEQLPDALIPDVNGNSWSGSTVVDWKNTSGLQLMGKGPPMIAFYTNASLQHPNEQFRAVSHDRGRTFTQLKEAVIPGFEDEIRKGARDPKVQWHEPSNQWIMVLYVQKGIVFLYSSTDLRSWGKLQEISFDDAYECPDFFELPVAGDPDGGRYWVLMMADGSYQIGTFSGYEYRAITPNRHAEFGMGYASATFNNEPQGRRVQMSWIKPPLMWDEPIFKDVPFLGVMSLPVELSLVRLGTSRELYVRRAPVAELAALRQHPALLELGQELLSPRGHDTASLTLGNNQQLTSLPSTNCGLDVLIQAKLPRGATLDVNLRPENLPQRRNLQLRLVGKQVDDFSEDETGIAEVQWDDQNFTHMPIHVQEDGNVELRIVVDWGTIEIFDVIGHASMSLYAANLVEYEEHRCAPQRVELSGDTNSSMAPVLQAATVYQMRNSMK